MASVSKDAKGWRVRFQNRAGQWKQFRPGKMSAKAVEQVRRHVSEIESSQATAEPLNRLTAVWINSIGEPLYQKLAKHGLVSRRATATVADFVADFIERGLTKGGQPAGDGTKRKWKAETPKLVEFMGTQSLRSVDADDVISFRQWLGERVVQSTGSAVTENSIRSTIAVCKRVFESACERELLDSNPFAKQVTRTMKNRERQRFINPEWTPRIMDACPNAQWRLMVALWRLAGLRKAEVFWLRWSDVLWDTERLWVKSPKTARYEGREERLVPAADVMPWLREVFEQAPEGSDRIITLYRESNTNLDKPLKEILYRAGLSPWPKLFNNMRSTCETEWLDRINNTTVVAAWMGHSEVVQREHYAQIDEHHFEQFRNQAPRWPQGGQEQDGNGQNRVETENLECSFE